MQVSEFIERKTAVGSDRRLTLPFGDVAHKSSFRTFPRAM